MTLTRDDLMAHLRRHAQPVRDGRWNFAGSPAVHTEQEALQIVEACMILDVPVTDVMTSRAWLAIITRLTTLEQRIETLEGPRVKIINS